MEDIRSILQDNGFQLGILIMASILLLVNAVILYGMMDFDTMTFKDGLSEFFPYLLPRQLDAEGAEVLQSLLEAQGLRIITSGSAELIEGNERAVCIPHRYPRRNNFLIRLKPRLGCVNFEGTTANGNYMRGVQVDTRAVPSLVA